jgi:hypothetical protein
MNSILVHFTQLLYVLQALYYHLPYLLTFDPKGPKVMGPEYRFYRQ